MFVSSPGRIHCAQRQLMKMFGNWIAQRPLAVRKKISARLGGIKGANFPFSPSATQNAGRKRRRFLTRVISDMVIRGCLKRNLQKFPLAARIRAVDQLSEAIEFEREALALVVGIRLYPSLFGMTVLSTSVVEPKKVIALFGLLSYNEPWLWPIFVWR